MRVGMQAKLFDLELQRERSLEARVGRREESYLELLLARQCHELLLCRYARSRLLGASRLLEEPLVDGLATYGLMRARNTMFPIRNLAFPMAPWREVSVHVRIMRYS